MSTVQQKTPTELETLKADLYSVLDRDASNRDAWIEIKLETARLVATARKKFKDNESFGKWFDKEIGTQEINKNDRAAYIEMAKQPEIMREVLEDTKRSSVQHIFEKEFKKAAGIGTGAKAKAKAKPSASKTEAGAAPKAPVSKPLFTEEQFNILLMAVHPDRHNAVTLEEKTAATQLLMSFRDALVGTPAEKKAAKAKAAKAKAAPKAKPAPAKAQEAPAQAAA